MKTFNLNRAIFAQRDAARWYSISIWARERFIETSFSGYVNECENAASIANHHARRARFFMGIECGLAVLLDEPNTDKYFDQSIEDWKNGKYSSF